MEILAQTGAEEAAAVVWFAFKQRQPENCRQ
jgi:hypothetical protein